MKKVFYILALVLSTAWIVGFFILGAGAVIHSVLMTGMVFYLRGLICGDGFKQPGGREEIGYLPERG